MFHGFLDDLLEVLILTQLLSKCWILTADNVVVCAVQSVWGLRLNESGYSL
jgi:hypothetical protein